MLEVCLVVLVVGGRGAVSCYAVLYAPSKLPLFLGGLCVNHALNLHHQPTINGDTQPRQDVKDNHEEAAIAAPQALKLCQMVRH